jgi:hypothetical protein
MIKYRAGSGALLSHNLLRPSGSLAVTKLRSHLLCDVRHSNDAPFFVTRRTQSNRDGRLLIVPQASRANYGSNRV